MDVGKYVSYISGDSWGLLQRHGRRRSFSAFPRRGNAPFGHVPSKERSERYDRRDARAAYAIEGLELAANAIFIVGSACFLPAYAHDMDVFLLLGAVNKALLSLFFGARKEAKRGWVCFFSILEFHPQEANCGWVMFVICRGLPVILLLGWDAGSSSSGASCIAASLCTRSVRQCPIMTISSTSNP